jgi:hypothetical protein
VGGSVTPNSQVAAHLADVQQAAYFHHVLAIEQTELAAAMKGVRLRLESSREAGNRIEANRLHILLRGPESELSQVNGLVARLEKRFAAEWPAV